MISAWHGQGRPCQLDAQGRPSGGTAYGQVNGRRRSNVQPVYVAPDPAEPPAAGDDCDEPDPLTPKQREVLDALIKIEEKTGCVPSQRSIAERIGISPSTLGRHVRALERNGLVELVGKQHRIKLTGGTNRNER